MTADDYHFEPGWAERAAADAAPERSRDEPRGGLSPEDPRRNLLLDPRPVEYAVERTAWGVWKRHVAPDGRSFSEFTSHRSLGRLPWVHMTFGKDPATGRRKTAKGVVAVGRWAVGCVAAGQFAVGLVVAAQFGLGLFAGVGQFATGAVCVGQFAAGAVLAVGQFAVADVAFGQFAAGRIAIGQIGWGGAVLDLKRADPAARQWLRQVLGV